MINEKGEERGAGRNEETELNVGEKKFMWRHRRMSTESFHVLSRRRSNLSNNTSGYNNFKRELIESFIILWKVLKTERDCLEMNVGLLKRITFVRIDPTVNCRSTPVSFSEGKRRRREKSFSKWPRKKLDVVRFRIRCFKLSQLIYEKKQLN